MSIAGSGAAALMRGQARIRAHAARLYNDGLEAAREGRTAHARDRFAACVYWYPHDLEARSALALACFECGDLDEARDQWTYVLGRSKAYEPALQGLALLADAESDV